MRPLDKRLEKLVQGESTRRESPAGGHSAQRRTSAVNERKTLGVRVLDAKRGL